MPFSRELRQSEMIITFVTTISVSLTPAPNKTVNKRKEKLYIYIKEILIFSLYTYVNDSKVK